MRPLLKRQLQRNISLYTLHVLIRQCMKPIQSSDKRFFPLLLELGLRTWDFFLQIRVVIKPLSFQEICHNNNPWKFYCDMCSRFWANNTKVCFYCFYVLFCWIDHTQFIWCKVNVDDCINHPQMLRRRCYLRLKKRVSSFWSLRASPFLLWNDAQLQPKLLDRLDFCCAVF